MPGRIPKGFSEIRIIGGTLRSRKIVFPEIAGLRPTPNRIRETLFNWLSPKIRGTKCLDLFAGSGALGFEALSRGAEYCLMIDSSKDVITALHRNEEALSCHNIDIIQATFPYSVTITSHKFDIVFIDPPFHQNYIEAAMGWLKEVDCLNSNAWIYVEVEKELTNVAIPAGWSTLKAQTAGQVRYYLFEVK